MKLQITIVYVTNLQLAMRLCKLVLHISYYNVVIYSKYAIECVSSGMQTNYSLVKHFLL